MLAAEIVMLTDAIITVQITGICEMNVIEFWFDYYASNPLEMCESRWLFW